VDVGRFSVRTKAADSVESAVRMWNPMCQASILTFNPEPHVPGKRGLQHMLPFDVYFLLIYKEVYSDFSIEREQSDSAVCTDIWHNALATVTEELHLSILKRQYAVTLYFCFVSILNRQYAVPLQGKCTRALTCNMFCFSARTRSTGHSTTAGKTKNSHKSGYSGFIDKGNTAQQGLVLQS
jgi:hypothetical protein